MKTRDPLQKALARLADRWRASQGSGSGVQGRGRVEGRGSRVETPPQPQGAHATPGQAPQVSLAPGCAYGVRYAQLLEDLQRDLAEVKARLNGLLFLLAGTVALDVVIRLIK